MGWRGTLLWCFFFFSSRRRHTRLQGDWSSDVCSSDLQQLGLSLLQAGFLLSTVQVAGMVLGLVVGLGADRWGLRRSMLAGLLLMAGAKIGRASCRGRGEISVGAGSLKKKKK